MKRRTAGLGGLIVLIAAASLLVVPQAGAGKPRGASAIGCTSAGKANVTRTPASARRGIQSVRGHFPAGETIQGSLTGTWIVTGLDFETFRYDQATGVMRFQVTEEFTGTVNGVGGAPGDKLYFKGYVIQRFKPGTPLGTGVPGGSTGTTDDASTWRGGSCLHPVTGGDGAFAGASGLVYMLDEAPGVSNYWGVVRL
jgi:hypothetical protein